MILFGRDSYTGGGTGRGFVSKTGVTDRGGKAGGGDAGLVGRATVVVLLTPVRLVVVSLKMGAVDWLEGGFGREEGESGKAREAGCSENWKCSSVFF